MRSKINSLKNHFIICGFGDIGCAICSVLHEFEIPFVVIESKEEYANQAIQRKFLTIKGKATYDTTLIQSGIKKAQGVVICLGDDSANIHVSLAAREINPDIYIIVRGYEPHIEKRMVRAGANSVVNPLKLGGQQIAEQIINQYKKTNNLYDSISHRSTIMGYSLKMYQHFQDKPTSIKKLKADLDVAQVLKIRKADGTEVDNPLEDKEISNHEIVLLLINEDDNLSKKQSRDHESYSYIEWTVNLSIGINQIDEEHKELIELINGLLNALDKGKEREILIKTFDELIDYTSIHFKTEEDFFKKYKYPDADSHIKEHERLTNEVLNLNKNKEYIFTKNIADFLSSWLKDHILDSDMKYKEFFSDKGIL